MHEVMRTDGLSGNLIRDFTISLEAGKTMVVADSSQAEINELSNILNGTAGSYGGHVFIDGKEQNLTDVIASQNAGIFVIGRSEIIIPNLSIEENIGIQNPLERSFLIDRKKQRALTQYFFERFQIDADPQAMPFELTAYQLREVELFKAITLGARVVVISEFFESYTLNQRELLMDRIQLLNSLEIAVLLLISQPHPEWAGFTDSTVTLHNGVTGLRKDGDAAEILPAKDSDRKHFKLSHMDDSNSYIELLRPDLNVAFQLPQGKLTALVDIGNQFPKTEISFRNMVLNRSELHVNGSIIDGKEKTDAVSVASYSFRDNRIIKSLSVRENISIHVQKRMSIGGVINSRINRYLIAQVLNTGEYFSELKDHLDDENCYELSDTVNRELEMARSVIMRPKLLFVLCSGLRDSKEKNEQLYELCHHLCNKGFTIAAVITDFTELDDMNPDFVKEFPYEFL